MDTEPLCKRSANFFITIRTWVGNNRATLAGAVAGLFVSLFFIIYISAPFDFDRRSYVNIPQGTSVREAAARLKERHIIRSPLWFEISARLLGKGIVAGEYYFDRPQSAIAIARRLNLGRYDIEPVRVTIPEGANVYEIGRILSRMLPDFDEKRFIAEASAKEGYLFPDTYFFYPGAEPATVLETMENNFNVNVAKAATSTVAFGKSLNDIVVMASILEEEASEEEDRRIIAGILWRRIAMGIPLQVDAVFPYIIGKNSFELTHADLKTDSPYNTYTNKGLPPGPITNPGLNAIVAAATPITTTYLYYLSDLNGVMHYCSTYTCHLVNKKKYLGT